MRRQPSLSDQIIKQLGRPLTPEEAHVLMLAEVLLEGEEQNGKDGSDDVGTIH